MAKKIVSRRSFLKSAAISAIGIVAAGCQARVVEKVVRETVIKEVEKVVKETVIVEKEVTKEVQVEKVVEKIVIATPVPEKAEKPAIQSFIVPLCWLFNDEFVVPAAAIELGYYKEAGFPSVALVSGGGSTGFDPVIAINGFDNRVRVGIQASMAEVVKAYAAGVDVIAVGALLQEEPCSFVTLITEERRAQSPCDFKDRVVAMQSEAQWYVDLLGKLCSEGPLELGTDFTWISAGWTPDCLMAVGKGACDFYCCWATNQPFMLEQQGLKKGVDYELFLVADFLPFYYGDVIITSRNYLERHPEKVEAFVQATMKAAQYVLDHPDEAIEIASRIEGVDPAHAEWRIPIQNELVTSADTEAHGVGYMDIERVQEMIDFLYENGQIDHAFSAEEMVDNSFILGS